MRIARIPALLVGTVIAAPLSAQVPNVHAAARAPGNGSTVVIWPRNVQSLQARLDSFAVALPPAERALWDGVLLRAAHAPTPATAEVRVTPVLQIGPGGGCDATPGVDEAANRVAIVVQGGRTAGASGIVVQGGRTPAQREGIVVQGGRTPAQREGIVVQGGRTPAQPEGIVVQGGRTPAQPEGIVVQGGSTPPQSLGHRLADFSLRLSPEERGALNWLLTRASATDVGLPPGPCNPERGCSPPAGGSPLNVSLRQALGIDPLAIGPKPEDPGRGQPARGRTEERWILRF
jgi:hypothetical protein